MNDWGNVIFVYLVCVFLLYTVKPLLMFKTNGQIRQYGVGKDLEGDKKTLMNVYAANLLFALIAIKINK